MDSNNCCISRDTRVSDMRITAAVTFKNQICINIIYIYNYMYILLLDADYYYLDF